MRMRRVNDMALFRKEEKPINQLLDDSKDTPEMPPTLEEAKRKYRKRPKEVQPEPALIPDKALEEFFKPEVWKEVVGLPFHIRKAMTGNDLFSLSVEQETALSAPLIVMLRSLVGIDSKYIALAVFCLNFASIWGEKEILYSMQMKREKAKKAKTDATA
jgi:hypothetical protein